MIEIGRNWNEALEELDLRKEYMSESKYSGGILSHYRNIIFLQGFISDPLIG
ncbi:hypothetical protein [Elizabethkingia bruuniana]|uniref:hypothetical protein n=1 Tax=Elizabethkingia bruuniana TaxID=1756149 RepID=UPI0012FD0097|nr:hypothetical protein [Elizabethkingia bruuniana]